MQPNKVLMAMLMSAGLMSNPASAAVDPEVLMQAYEKLLQRVEQLEAANKKLEAAVTENKGAEKGDLAARVEDVESEIIALRKPSALEDAMDGVSLSASLTMVAQHMDAEQDAGELTGRADVEIVLPMGSIGSAQGKLFGHLRAGDGEGVDTGAFAPSNSAAFGHESRMDLMQAWVHFDIPVGGADGKLDRIELTAGKIDPFGFFDGNNIADDESEQFLNLAFIHNPLLDAGGDIGVGDDGGSPGLRLAYVNDVNGSNNFAASIGIFGSGDDGANFTDSFDGGLVIGQLEYSGKTIGNKTGAYRLYGWSNSNAWDLVNALDVDGNPTIRERHNGWGISLDQQIAEHVTLFSRVGFSTKSVVEFDRAFTVGAQFDGGMWGRESDRIGLAAGWLKPSSEHKAASGVTGTETPVELYYVWQLNDHLHLSPSIQWINNPAGNKTADDVTVWSLRAKAAF